MKWLGANHRPYDNYHNSSFSAIQDSINRRYAEQQRAHQELIRTGGVSECRQWPGENTLKGKFKSRKELKT